MRQIYGIDVSEESFDVNFLSTDNEAKGFVVKNRFKNIVKFINSLPKGSVICAEFTGVYCELLTFIACIQKVPIALASGYQIKHSLGLQKGKTDALDASRIREYGERFFDKLRFVSFPEAELKELKEIYNLRAQLVQDHKRLLTNKKGKKNLPYQSIKVHQITQKFLSQLEKGIEELEAEILMIIKSKEELKANFKLITGIKGIGAVTACEVIIKTDNFTKINTARKAASYAGICPFKNASGKMVKKSKVSHMADKKMKTLFYLCAAVAIRYNPEYKLYYLRKKQEGKPYFLILNNVANKLLRTIYSITNSRLEYSLGHITNDPRTPKKVA
jgi:transposase